MIRRLNLPVRDPADVVPHLGAPHHFREGRSAKLIADMWFEANDLPVMIRHTLSQASRFAGAELVDGFLERHIDLGDGHRPSQADVLAVVGLPNELAVMAVEGKVDESFGPFVSDWLRDASSAKTKRLRRLCATLGIDPAVAQTLRYQLLHRTASAIYEAHRYRARIAIMMVHSFDPMDAGVGDFVRFATAVGLPGAAATRLVGPASRDGVDLYLGWTADRPSNEGFTIINGRKTDSSFFDDD